MHRNTYILVIFLAIFAALVAGINIGKSMNPTPAVIEQLQATPSATPILKAAVVESHIYTNPACGVQLEYPLDFTLGEQATYSALFNQTKMTTSILFTCQKDIPRPPLPTDSIETVKITNAAKTATVSAKLYHDASPEDGSKVDVLIFYNAKIQKDIFIAGYGPDFNETIKTVRLYP